MNAAFGNFRRCQSGNIAMLFGLLLFVMLAAAGVALDYQRAVTIKANMQEAADAALIAAVKLKATRPNMTDSDVQARAKAFFDSNMRNKLSYSYSDFDVSFDPITMQYTLDFDSRIKTALVHAVNFAKIEPKIVSKAKLGKPPYLEVVMVLDNTGSMNDHGKLGDLKNAAKNLVTSLHASAGADVKIGLVPFAQYVSVGDDEEGAAWLDGASPVGAFDGCVGSRGYPANTTDADYAVNPVPEITGAPCPNELLALTENKSVIDAAIDDMTGDGWTYIPAGLVWGWRIISAAAPYTEGATETELKDKNGTKAIILMTDGENTKSPDYPTHDDADIVDANKITGELCDAIKDEDIIVYTIAFAVTDAVVKTLLQDCGSTPGHFFEPDTAGELNGAFEAIGGALRNISLTQ